MNFIKTNWKNILIIALILFVAIGGYVTKCTSNQVDNIVTQSILDTQLSKQKKDLTVKFLSENDSIKNELQEAQKKISDGLKPKIVIQYKTVEKLVEAVRKDTATTELCDSAINAQESLIFDLGLKSNSDSIQLKLCSERIIIKDSIVKSISVAYSEQVLINSNLNGAVIKANKGKNLKWWFLGAGAILTFLVVK